MPLNSDSDVGSGSCQGVVSGIAAESRRKLYVGVGSKAADSLRFGSYRIRKESNCLYLTLTERWSISFCRPTSTDYFILLHSLPVQQPAQNSILAGAS